MQNKKSLTLFLTMLKIGAFTFGGGYAMISLIEDEFVTKKKWLSANEMSNILALSQSIPGAISVNCSIIIGYKQQRVWGALCAIFGLALPSLITISIIAFLYKQFSENLYIYAALKGIRACVVSLIFSAFIRLSKPIEKNVYTITLFIISFLLITLTSIKTVYIIIIGIVIGLISNLFIKEEEK